MKKSQIPEKKKKSRAALIIALCVVLLAAATAAAVIYNPAASEFLKGAAAKLTALNQSVQPEAAENIGAASKIKLYSPITNAVAPNEITSANLKSSKNEYNVEGGVNALYDGIPETCSGDGTEWVTLDAGKLKALSYIRYLPATASQDAANSCVGTRFYGSKDNESFVELGAVLPDANGNLALDWHMIEFSGYGMYRYFKAELSPGASFGEIEWMCDDGIISEDTPGKQTPDGTSFKFTAFEAAAEFPGRVLLAVFNRGMVLKNVQAVDCNFVPGEYYDIEFNNIDVELGDYIRVMAYDYSTMEEAVPSPLTYRFTEASSHLSMANIYSDNMMFQADTDLVIFGKAPCGSVVEAEITNTDTGEAYAGSDIAKGISEWEINFGAFPNGGNYSLSVYADGEELDFKNITFGDIWVFAGQSNMEFYLCGEKKGEDLLKTDEGKKLSETSDIRIVNLFNIGRMGARGAIEDVPLNDWNGYWSEMTPDRAPYLSAVAYYFAQGLRERYGRNVGIISVAVGDTEINQWYPRGVKNGVFSGTDGRLYNNRIYPFTKQKIKGILWYQGEADQYITHMDAEEYSDAMSGLINEYRNVWNDPELPFYYVQLARYATKDESEIREGQRIALQKLRSNKNVGMFSLLDIIGAFEQGAGCARTDIHPWQKDVVACRFLDIVGHDIYGDKGCPTTGPRYESMTVEGDKVVLTFKHTGSLRVMSPEQYADSVCSQKIDSSMTDTNVLHEFYVSDKENRYYPAEAEIAGDRVVVYSDEVAEPQGVLYAWGAYPEMPNLTDDTGLPAFTFNTMNGSEFQ